MRRVEEMIKGQGFRNYLNTKRGGTIHEKII
jgi:hypothetical protein